MSSPTNPKDLLIKIRKTNERFYNEFVREFLTDRTTLTNFERDLIYALHAIVGITIFTNEVYPNYVHVRHGRITDKFDDYQTALEFSIALLTIK